MKRLIIVALLVAGFSSLFHSNVRAQDTPKVLLFICDGRYYSLGFSLEKEVGVMKKILEQSGFNVSITTVSGEPLSAGSTRVTPDLKLSDIEVADYAGFILPCMSVGSSPYRSVAPEAVSMVKKAAADGKPVAAQRGSVLTLAKAGVLEGKKYAFKCDLGVNRYKNEFPDFKGAVYSGTGVVRDGNIITSGVCPVAAMESGLNDGTEELTRALIAAIQDNK